MSKNQKEKSPIVFDPDKWYTTTQVVELARQGYSPFKSLSTLYKLINEGKLNVVIRGDENRKKFFIQGKDISSFAESQKVTVSQSNGKPLQKGRPKTHR